MAKTYQIHSAYNAQAWIWDGDNMVTDKDGNPIVDSRSTHYDARSGKAPLPHSIVVDQKVDNFDDVGALPDVLTANSIENLSSKFEDLLTIDDSDYPMNKSKDGLNGVEVTTKSGNQVIRYYYKIPRNSEGVALDL